MDNEQIETIREYYRKTEKSPFVFNMQTGEVIPTPIKFNPVGTQWRFITAEWYPVYDVEKYVSWEPFGFEDMAWTQVEGNISILI